MNFDEKRFRGCIPNPFYTPSGLRAMANADRMGVSEVRKWEEFATLIEDQGQTGTCEAVSATTVVEALMRKLIDKNLFAPNLGLDWRAVHRGAWRAVNGGKTAAAYSEQDGLPLGASLAWMQEKGILPGGALILDIGDSASDMADALEWSPVQIGTVVHDGFRPERVSELGEIGAPHAVPPDSGHAMALTGMIGGRDGAVMDTLAQSWGVGYGFKGWVQVNHLTLAWGFIDRPRYVYVRPEVAREWVAQRKRWEPFIVERAA